MILTPMPTDLISKGELFSRLCDQHLPAETVCIINNMPTEQLTPATGNWEEQEHGVRCTHCGTLRESFYRDFKYCPECGAYMGGNKC